MFCCKGKLVTFNVVLRDMLFLTSIPSRYLTSSTVCFNYAASKEKYGYILTDQKELKRNKDMQGTLHIGLVTLPTKLKDSLSLFHEKHPRKRITEDGLKLSRHLRNRGRPAHSTWTKYKAQRKDKKEERHDGRDSYNSLTLDDRVMKFSLNEAVKAGLIDDQLQSSDAKEEVQINDESKKSGVTKRPHLSEYSMIRYGARESQAYVASQLPFVYGTTLRSLQEIQKREPLFKPSTLLDFGSGSGMTVWAANEVWQDSIKEYQCVDASEHMNDLAEYLLRGSSDITTPLKIPNVYFKRFLPLSNQLTYDVVVASHTLTEMPFRVQRMQAIKSLWRKTNNFMVIVEPGNNEGFDIALQARNFITENNSRELTIEEEEFEDLFSDFDVDTDKMEDEGHVFAPCPHELTCSRSYVETRDHPCNFSQKVELSFAQRNTSLKKHGYSSERFSYLILKKGPDPRNREEKTSWSRVLQPMKKRNRHVICELCCSNGNIEKHVFTKKKDPFIYKSARHCLEWGDMLPLNEAKRPMNIRVPIPPEEKKKLSKNTR